MPSNDKEPSLEDLKKEIETLKNQQPTAEEREILQISRTAGIKNKNDFQDILKPQAPRHYDQVVEKAPETKQDSGYRDERVDQLLKEREEEKYREQIALVRRAFAEEINKNQDKYPYLNLQLDDMRAVDILINKAAEFRRLYKRDANLSSLLEDEEKIYKKQMTERFQKAGIKITGEPEEKAEEPKEEEKKPEENKKEVAPPADKDTFQMKSDSDVAKMEMADQLLYLNKLEAARQDGLKILKADDKPEEKAEEKAEEPKEEGEKDSKKEKVVMPSGGEKSADKDYKPDEDLSEDEKRFARMEKAGIKWGS